jgi:alginate O-acetyltransferase complex protein AlgJ
MQGSLSLPVVAASRGGGPTDTAHDARLRRGIIDTAVSRPVAFGVTIVFLLLIYAVPIGQAILERSAGEDSTVLALFRHVPDRENLRRFEKDLEQASYAKDFAQPRLQLLLSRFGRVGNKRAVIGRDRWLYYAPGVAHVAGPSFLDPDVIRSREKEVIDDDAAAEHADPRPAVFALFDMLAARGIKLVLFPVPDKAMLQPMELHGRGDRAKTIPVARNIGWGRFVDEVRARGVAVFDPAPLVLSPGEKPRYLVEDTHWTPGWMEQVARDLAEFVRQVASLPPVTPPRLLHVAAETVTRTGDLVDMLKLPDKQTVFEPQQVIVHRVADESGADWEPDPASDVLLLGDSFTNVFSMEPMGWGTAAGLAPHLSLALGRAVDVIAQNDAGAFATRQSLARELAAGDERLAGKRVVIWEFAARELSVGDWKPIDWHGPPGEPTREGAR